MPNALRIQKEIIAMEVFSTANVGDMLKRAFPVLVAEVKDLFGTIDPAAPAIPLPKDAKAFISEIKKHRYLDISPLTAYVPAGLEATYDIYETKLRHAVEHCDGIFERVLNPYASYLSQLITNKEAQLETINKRAYHKQMELTRDEINKEIGSVFKKGSTVTQSSLGSVVSRNNDWEPVMQRVFLLSDRMNRIDRKALTKKITECSQLLDTLHGMIRRGEMMGVTPEVVENLSEGAYQVARELEFYSVTFYRVQALAESVNNTTASVMATLKR